jgi:DNA invertase Pin-like site-specific DNA recombinase
VVTGLSREAARQPSTPTRPFADLSATPIFGALAKFERGLIAERTRAGVTATRKRGVKFGRKSKLSARLIEQARKLIAAGDRPEDVAASFHVGRSTLYRAVAGEDADTAGGPKKHGR